MNNKDIAKFIDRIAVLLELKGENQFRVRAYQNASRVIQNYKGSTEELINDINQGRVKGVGEALHDKINELYKTGGLDYLEKLQNEFPDGLLNLLDIPGLGAKKVKALYEQLTITNLDKLEKACKAGKVAELKGFGKKTEENILLGIERVRKYSNRFSIAKALTQSQTLIGYLKQNNLCENLEVAGSLRRHKETVKDIDLIASSKNPEKLMNHFVAYQEVESVIAHGETKSSILLSSGIAVDLRVVSKDQFPAALLHFTGSKEHNTSLRSIAKKHDLKLNEYGLFKGEVALELKTEKEIYRELELAFIEPELREDRGEIEQAHDAFLNNKELPKLVTVQDIKGVLHAHSDYSDGANTLREMALAAKGRGYSYFGISDHSQSAKYANGLSFDRVKKQHEEIDRLNEELAPFRIFKGIESDILSQGQLDYKERELETFDFVIASVHSGFSLKEKEMTQRVLRAIENPFTTILAHPTGRLLLKREAYEIDLGAILESAAEHGVAIELNANPRRLDLDWRYHQRAKDLGITIPICPDAHRIEGIDDIHFGVGIARKGGLLKNDVLNTKSVEQIALYFKQQKEKK